MSSKDDQPLRHGPEGLSMSPTERRGRVRRSMSSAEERRRLKALERDEWMLTEDLRMAGPPLEMIEAQLMPRHARAMMASDLFTKPPSPRRTRSYQRPENVSPRLRCWRQKWGVWE